MRLLRDNGTPVLCKQEAQWLKVQEFQTCNFIYYVVPYNVVYQYYQMQYDL